MSKTSTPIKIVIKIVITILICVWLTSFTNGLAPIIGNDVMLGQLENSDMNFAIMQAWTQLQNRIHITQCGIGILCIIGIVYDVFNYFSTKEVN